jgi:hypothetical protein
MPRFVLLFHECPPESSVPSHWDLMLERHGVLMTWRLAELPPAWSRVEQPNPLPKETEAPPVRLPDHRLAYLDYEGPLSGNRGEVCRYDGGTYDVLKESGEQLVVNFAGEWVKGRFALPTGPPPLAPA